LIAKRAELAGEIEHTQDQLRQLVIDLDHIDASIHIFDPTIERWRSRHGLCRHGIKPSRAR